MSDSLKSEIYLITPPEINDPAAFALLLDEALTAAPVACLQLRLKGASDDQILKVGKALIAVCERHEVAFLVNDRADLAATLQADGVHIGQSDGSIAEARKALGYDCDVGVTCHDSMHLAFEAGESGADYIAFGAFFDSDTKDAQYKAQLDLLTRWREIAEIPSVAIGGITADNCAPLVQAGADFLAVSGAVWRHPDGPGAGVRALKQAIDAASK